MHKEQSVDSDSQVPGQGLPIGLMTPAVRKAGISFLHGSELTTSTQGRKHMKEAGCRH